ncbi:hypothetical protein ACR777_14485 [Sphingobacterium spiritivorum]|uniref:hypothetical protein n=1 Tax=Sphingobacterium spiritivorum TaxID=258 RepID=UPI003DA5D490
MPKTLLKIFADIPENLTGDIFGEKEDKPTVLITDWYKDNQTRIQVLGAIKRVLNDTLPESYDRAVYSMKCDIVFDHFVTLAQIGVA